MPGHLSGPPEAGPCRLHARMRDRKHNARTDALLNWLGDQKARTRYAVSASVCLGLLSGFLLVAQAWCLAQVVYGVIIEHLVFSQVAPWMWIMLAVFPLRAILA